MNITQLKTEAINDKTKAIDQMSSKDIVELINNEDQKVAVAIKEENNQIAQAIDEIALRLKKGGRLIYIGAGTSGRIGILDAVELLPTYNVSATQAFGVIAGGKPAMYEAIEGIEDSKEAGRNDLEIIQLNRNDSVIGLAASGRTPYTIAALNYANQVGALIVSISCNKGSEIESVANIAISPQVGPEVISGSTRMKAGTAQKMIVNMISTGVMIKLHKVYQNYMINVQLTNEKLRLRAEKMLSQITNLNQSESKELLALSKDNVATAIVMHFTGLSCGKAILVLEEKEGNIREIIEEYKNTNCY